MKSGFITLIGKPNVGKSSLLNEIIGEKIAIMSPKPQTTRNNILGIYTNSDMQAIFIDTPGLHNAKSKLNEKMVDETYKSLKGVDICILMMDISMPITEYEKKIIDRLKNYTIPVFLVLNKIDLVSKLELIKRLEEVNKLMNFKEIFPLSVKNKDNIDTLLNKVYEYLPEGPMYYPEDQITDVPEKFVVSELIREKVLFLTNEEVPHSVAVTDVLYLENNTISATIIVERESQKKIIIGHNGSMIKEIGKRARLDINKLLGKNINLELWVKVKENWRNKVLDVKSYGNYND